MSAWALHSVSHGYGAKAVLQQVSLTAEPGDRIAVVGPSGAGKSTLARLGVGLETPRAGRITVADRDTRTWRRKQWRAAGVQLLVQRPAAMLHPTLPLRVSLEESAWLYAAPQGAVDRVLEQVRLTSRQQALPTELSGGELRRAGLARVLLGRPKLLVADEPTTGLDSHLKADVLQLLGEAVGPQGVLVLITHDLVAARVACHRAVVLCEGAIVDDLDLADPVASHPVAVALLSDAELGAQT